jgi:NTE family protein
MDDTAQEEPQAVDESPQSEEEPVTSNTTEDAPVATYTTEDAPVANDITQEESTTTDTTEDAPVSIDTTEEEPSSTDTTEDASVATDITEEEPPATYTIEDAPVATNTAEEEAPATDTPQDSSVATNTAEQEPPATDTTEDASVTIEPSGEAPAALYSTVDLPMESIPKKIALILSGGGARGAFQVGAEKYARDGKGYHWDIIAGVSVGAMNGAMLAMHRYVRLMQIWDNISDGQVYTGGFNPLSLVKLLFGAKSFYGNAPLQKLMEHEFEAGRIIDDLHVGAVSLISGEYVQFTRESLELSKAILASASIPVVFPPVDVSPDYASMVDGGVRNLSPVGDVLDLEPDEIVIINCGSEQPPVTPQAGANVLSIGMRALDIMQNEIFINDMKEFLRINALVKEAEQQGCVLHHPKTGRVLKYYPYQIIEPDGELGGVLDFSQKSVQASMKAGVRRAREVLGRP